MIFARHSAAIAAVVRAALVVAVCASARTAAAYDCYEVKQGTKRYAEVMAETAVGEAAADVVGLGESSTDIVVAGRTLHCFDRSPVTGLRLHVCIDSGPANKH